MRPILFILALFLALDVRAEEVTMGASRIKIETTDLSAEEARLVLAKLYGGLYFLSDEHERHIARYFPRSDKGPDASFIFSVVPSSITLIHKKEARRIFVSWPHTAASSRCDLDVSYIELESPTEKIQIESASVMVTCYEKKN
jgi:hypothetical protein